MHRSLLNSSLDVRRLDFPVGAATRAGTRPGRPRVARSVSPVRRDRPAQRPARAGTTVSMGRCRPCCKSILYKIKDLLLSRPETAGPRRAGAPAGLALLGEGRRTLDLIGMAPQAHAL